MSDIQSNEPSSTEPSAPVASVEEGKPIESGTITESMPSADTSIPSGSETSSAGDAGNVAAAVEGGAPVTDVVAADGADADSLAAALNGSAMTDMVATAAVSTVSDLPRGNQLVNSGVTLDAPVLTVENDLNPLVPAAGTEGPPASQLAAQAALPEAEELPRESHLMLLESKFAAILAKLRNQERVAVDELEAVYAHVKAVL